MGNTAIVAGYHITKNGPNVNEGGKCQQLADTGNHHGKVGQHLSLSGICQKAWKDFLFFVHIHYFYSNPSARFLNMRSARRIPNMATGMVRTSATTSTGTLSMTGFISSS